MSIAELRQQCQPAHKKTIDPLMEWYVLRPVSIYFTWLFVKLGLRSNHVSIFGFLAAASGSVLLLVGDPVRGLFGAVLIWLSFLLDCVDGEVARYWGESSIRGTYLDYLVGGINDGMILLGLGFYVSAASGWDPRLVVTASVLLALVEKLTGLYVHSVVFRNCRDSWHDVRIDPEEPYAERVWFKLSLWQRLLRVPFETFFRVTLILVAMTVGVAVGSELPAVAAWMVIVGLGAILCGKSLTSELLTGRVETTFADFVKSLKSLERREREQEQPVRRSA